MPRGLSGCSTRCEERSDKAIREKKRTENKNRERERERERERKREKTEKREETRNGEYRRTHCSYSAVCTCMYSVLDDGARELNFCVVGRSSVHPAVNSF